MAVLIAATVALPAQSQAASPRRLGGLDRFETAALVAQEVRSRGLAGSTVLLASGLNFPDALVGGASPEPSVVLLTRPSSLPSSTLSVLRQPWVSTVRIVGGTAVVTSEVENQVRALGKVVERVAGPTRYETSLAVFGAATQNTRTSSVWLASGTSFADQLVAVAAARRTGGVVVIVPPWEPLTSETSQALRAGLADRAVVHVVDGSRALEAVSLDGVTIERHVADPFSNAVALQSDANDGTYVASGANWPDALAASRLVTPTTRLLLSRPTCSPASVVGEVTSALLAGRAVLIGGSMAIGTDVSLRTACPVGEAPVSRPRDECRLRDARVVRTQPYSVGFPLRPGPLGTPARGVTPVVLIPVAFADAPGDKTQIPRMLRDRELFDVWIADQSRGALSIEWRVRSEWLTLPTTSISYGIEKFASDYIQRTQALARDVIAAADPDTDFSGNPFVFFVFPDGVPGIPTDAGHFEANIATAEGRVAKFFGGGRFFQTIGVTGRQRELWSFWIHEMGHTWGLAGHGPSNIKGDKRLPASTHIMDDQNGLGLVLSAWDKMLMGWMPDREIVCVDAADVARSGVSSFDVALTALESSEPGVKALVIRLSSTRAIVVESRRAIGWSRDFTPFPGGVLAYVLDTSVDNDRSGEATGDAKVRFAEYLQPVNSAGSPRFRGVIDPFITVGGSASESGVTVQLVQGGANDTVRVSAG